MAEEKKLSKEAALFEAAGCLKCHQAPCQENCPAGIDIPSFIFKIKTGDIKGAKRVLYDKNIFSATCAAVCPVEELCQENCNKNQVSRSVFIGQLQGYAVEEGGDIDYPEEELTDDPRKIAVIGAGPAGMSGAYRLARAGHRVDLFEAGNRPGGTPYWGIPEWRLSREILEKEIKEIEKHLNSVNFNTRVGVDIQVEELLKDYDALMVCCGLGDGSSLRIKGAELEGTVDAVKFLKAHNTGENGVPSPEGKVVLVIGGGNTAMDAALAAKEAGAERSIVVYRRSWEEMPAWKAEIRKAIDNGVEFMLQTAPVEIVGRDKVEAMKLVPTRLVREKEGRRPRPVPLEGSEFVFPAGLIITALGQMENPLVEKLQDQEQVFFAGDAAGGDATVVQAVAGGKEAAEKIMVFFREQKESGV